MKNCTIPTSFLTEIVKLDPQSRLLVLTTCQQLADSDDDAIEQFTLPAGSPSLLIDFVKRLKRRIRCARRRRQCSVSRPKAVKKTDSSTATHDDNRPRVSLIPNTFDQAITMLDYTSSYLINNLYNIARDKLLALKEYIIETCVAISDVKYFLNMRPNPFCSVIPVRGLPSVR